MSAPPNAEMIRFWNEVAGPKWTRLQRHLDAQLAPFGQMVLERVAIRPGERVLDVGCGTGQLTVDAARRAAPGGSVLGVDVSEPMIACARERAAREGATGVELLVADAQRHPFEAGSIDAIVSRFGVMFFDDPVAAFGNLERALRRGGRLGFVCFQRRELNAWASVSLEVVLRHAQPPPEPPPGAPGPFALSDCDRTRSILEQAGFSAIAVEPVAIRGPIGQDLDAAGAAALLTELGPAAAVLREHPEHLEAVVRDLTETLLAHEHRGGVLLDYAVWLVTAVASS